jgi:hypothetical protein
LVGFNDLATVCPDVASEWHPTKNGNLKPYDVLSSTAQQIWWLCPQGHEYKSSLNSRVLNGKRKSGCPICAGKMIVAGENDLQSQSPHIAKEWHPTKNGDVTPDMVGNGSHKKYWWLCPIGHEYLASPENRTKVRGTGCPVCASETHTSFAEQSLYFYIKQWFPDAINRYNKQGYELDIFIPSISVGIEYDGKRYHTLQTREREDKKEAFYTANSIAIIRVKEYSGDHPNEYASNVIWTSTAGNQAKNLEAVLWDISKKLSCEDKFCSVDIARDSIEIINQYYISFKQNSLLAKAPDAAKEWDSELNLNLSPSQVSFGSGKRVWWKCPLGHSYMASVSSRTSPRKYNCPICAGQQLLQGYNDLATRYPEISEEWNYQRNNTSPDQVMPGSHQKVWWICPKGHEYCTSIASRTNRKSGCPYCSGRKAISGFNDLQTLFPEISQEWLYEKNGDENPNKISPFSHKKVWWKCPKGHEYYTAISNRTSNYTKYSGEGNGCPYCAGTRVLSGFNDLKSRYPGVAQKWHPTKNGNLTPDEVAPFSTKKAWWLNEDGTSVCRRIDSMVAMYKKRNSSSTNTE